MISKITRTIQARLEVNPKTLKVDIVLLLDEYDQNELMLNQEGKQPKSIFRKIIVENPDEKKGGE